MIPETPQPEQVEDAGSPEKGAKCPFSIQQLFSCMSEETGCHATQTEDRGAVYRPFRLPIEYVSKEHRHEVSATVSADLEMYSAPDVSGNSVYDLLCRPKNVFAKQILREMHRTYTTNTVFLEETQSVLENMGNYTEGMQSYIQKERLEPATDYAVFHEIWKDTKEDARFLEKYSYMEWSVLEYLNHSAEFLQSLSLIQFCSPVFSLLVPILFFVFPFAILKLRGVEITFDQYLETLREISRSHFIGKALNMQWTVESVLYTGITAALYFLQTYQNIQSCQKYYDNIRTINERLVYMKDFLRLSIRRMEMFVFLNTNYPSYADFCRETEKHMATLRTLVDEFDSITPFSHTLSKVGDIGYLLKCYYRLHREAEWETAVRYAVGFGAYMDNVAGMYENLRKGYLGKTTFSPESKTEFESQYYPFHELLSTADGCVRNHCDLSKNMILTGVNASGKTTFLKTTAINILVSQQFGVGFYARGELTPYTHVHSYLNIPDTSGRDSLFQAESRRCKEIIDKIAETSTEARHFCIFDELYSGTNPEEATQSATSLLKYLSKFGNVRFILTTHYIGVCKKFRKSDRVNNYKMIVKLDANGEFRYYYTLKKGISKMRGGVEILKKMNYPEEILRYIRESNGERASAEEKSSEQPIPPNRDTEIDT